MKTPKHSEWTKGHDTGYADGLRRATKILPVAKLILARLDMEADQTNDPVFICAAYRQELRIAIADTELKGEKTELQQSH